MRTMMAHAPTHCPLDLVAEIDSCYILATQKLLDGSDLYDISSCCLMYMKVQCFFSCHIYERLGDLGLKSIGRRCY
uniref:Uncharacterized protein n=1 Tax=Arundo donax TaxID=35708 RepID=A0A0A9GYN1_ARUDO